MATEVVVDGTTRQIRKGTLAIENRIEERSVARFVVVDTAEALTFQRGQSVIINDPDSNRIFGGVIDKPDSVSMSPNGTLLHFLQCVDWKYFADKRLVVASYQTTDAGDIVTDLHTNYLAAEGINIGSIQTGPEVAEAIFNYVSVSECLDALAELAGFTWFIDEDQDLYFIERTTYAAPFAATRANMIKGSPRLSTGNPLYRNYQYVRGGKGQTSQQTEDRTGDGENQAFTMGYPLAIVPTITEDAGGKTVGIKGLDTGKDYYWSKGDAVVFAAVAPGNGVAVQVIYTGQYPLITLATSEAERVARAAIEGGTGIVESIAEEAYHEDSTSSQESALAKIQHYAQDAQKFSYQTRTSGLRPGQLQPVTHSKLGLTAVDMLIESVIARVRGELIIYDVVAVVGPVSGSWARFFSGLMREMKSAIRIGDTDLVALLSQAESLSLAEVVGDDEDDFSSGIVNRWIYLPTAPPATGSPHNVQHEALDLAEVPSIATHATEDYDWDEAGVSLYGWATWA